MSARQKHLQLSDRPTAFPAWLHIERMAYLRSRSSHYRHDSCWSPIRTSDMSPRLTVSTRSEWMRFDSNITDRVCSNLGLQTGEYLALDFSETEHLVALTSLPHYTIEIWNWRTDRLLGVKQSDIISDDQYIRFGFFFRHLMRKA